MITMSNVRIRLMNATRILMSSFGEHGMLAGSGPRYENQCWTRDVSLALFPALYSMCTRGMNMPGTTTDKTYLLEIREKHLAQLMERQGPTGAIPILFADNFAELVLSKIGKGKWDGEALVMSDSFVGSRILDGMLGSVEAHKEFKDFPNDQEGGLYRLTPGTTDSELMFAYAVYSQKESTGVHRNHAARAIEYLEDRYVWNGLHHGADWRDTMEVFFRNKPLLTNNALLYTVYKMSGNVEKAEALKAEIERVLWDGETYLDYPDATRFDPLGGALGVLGGLIPEERYASVLAGFKSVDTPHGVTIECKHNPHQPGEAEVIERTQGVVVWPFVVGFTILAALEMGEHEFALEQFEKFHELDGFAEWYDPRDGSKWGEYEQGWSAALYVRVVEALVRRGLIA